jgi:F-type H+-transporting ATPase subunit epsilon
MVIAVDIVTPERVVMQTEAEAIVVPAIDGELGILQSHTPLLAQLQPGQIRLRRGSDVELFAVSGGFVEVNHNRVVIFAETAEMAEEINVERARQSAEQARLVLRSSGSPQDLEQAEASLRRALARLRVSELAQRYGKHTERVPGTR